MAITDHQAAYFAHELTLRHSADGVDRLSQSLFDASVDLNPHQIHAALFALKNLGKLDDESKKRLIQQLKTDKGEESAD